MQTAKEEKKSETEGEERDDDSHSEWTCKKKPKEKAEVKPILKSAMKASSSKDGIPLDANGKQRIGDRPIIWVDEGSDLDVAAVLSPPLQPIFLVKANESL